MKQGIKKIYSRVKYFRNLDRSNVVFMGKEVEQCSELNVALVIASDGRLELVLRVIREFLRARDYGLRLAVVLTVSKDSDIDFFIKEVDVHDWMVLVKCLNKPLGNKWQCSVQQAKNLEPQSVLITGSDDIVSRDYVFDAFKRIGLYKTEDLVGTNEWYIKDSEGNYLCAQFENASKYKLLGAGRMYSAELLDDFDWNLFESRFDSGLDVHGALQAAKYTTRGIGLNSGLGFVLSVKGEWPMLNSLHQLKRSSKISIRNCAHIKKHSLISKFESLTR